MLVNKLKDIYMSKESIEDIRNWRVDMIDYGTKEDLEQFLIDLPKNTRFPFGLSKDSNDIIWISYSEPGYSGVMVQGFDLNDKL